MLRAPCARAPCSVAFSALFPLAVCCLLRCSLCALSSELYPDANPSPTLTLLRLPHRPPEVANAYWLAENPRNHDGASAWEALPFVYVGSGDQLVFIRRGCLEALRISLKNSDFVVALAPPASGHAFTSTATRGGRVSPALCSQSCAQSLPATSYLLPPTSYQLLPTDY